MPRALYLDCFSGASGNMLLGALLDVGAPLDELTARLHSLPMTGWALRVEQTTRVGLSGTLLTVDVDPGVPQPSRGLADVLAVVNAGDLPSGARDRAAAVFQRLAEVEAAVHGTSTEAVHFHEVGAVDALVDVVGVATCLELLGLERGSIRASGLPLGEGWTRGEHGPLPVPAPATAALLARAGAPTRPNPGAGGGELTTPTGAALLTVLATFDQPSLDRVERVGYGFGSRMLPWPNALRAWLGEAAGLAARRDAVVVLETHLDDSTPERLGFAMERFFSAGALDVAFSPLQMKKNRPGVLLRVLAPEPLGEALAEAVLEHTSALGVRYQVVERRIAERRQWTVSTPWGAVRVKEKRLGERVWVAPEYEDCAALARSAGVPLSAVYDAARSASAVPGVQG